MEAGFSRCCTFKDICVCMSIDVFGVACIGGVEALNTNTLLLYPYCIYDWVSLSSE